ncbi:AraC family transcriptional regulator [Streptomyces sp. CB03911]|uniref:AraC family transcriptional regulator n=1 Tax=Streptomyces sp. CB03911 TaxID=1804758 RepID=UPI00093AECDA|nr:AraC family transcriptional regulator [Streptomyces sp. CB03911]OKI30634.1 AraC family transcriptional regulator [Streptomyces sp. CB03911]
MDLLSDVVALMRTGEPRSARVEWHSPWAQRFPAVRGSAGFQVILRGGCFLLPPAGPPVALGAGDVLFLPHGHGYTLADDPGTEPAEPDCDPAAEAELFVSAAAGDLRGPARTVTLCGGYRLDPGRAHPLLADLPELVHLPARPGHRPDLRAAVELLAGEVERPRPGADTVVTALLDMLLLLVLRAWFEDRPADGPLTGWAAALADPAVGAALHAVHRDPAHPWTVESLGARAGLSRAAFARRFGALVGRPPLGYLTWWRMTVAARLLAESDAPLGAVAAKVGYGSEFAFANAFKRERGIAPGAFRRQAGPGG